jgi:hypothetical protein
VGRERGKYGGEAGPYGGAAHGARTSGGPQGSGADNRPHLSWLRQAQLALASLLALPAEGPSPDLLEELMGRAAALFEAVRGSPWEVEFRRRGGLLAKETGPASRYEELRGQSVKHCEQRGGSEWFGPLGDIGRLQDECNSFVDWPLRSGQPQGQAVGLLQDLSFHDGPGKPLGQAPDWPAPSSPEAAQGGAGTEYPPRPTVTAEAFLAELDWINRGYRTSSRATRPGRS